MQPDVIVIGAGLAGLSAAWHLAPQQRVLVLDQAEQPGAEASAQNAGMARRLGEDPYERALALRTGAWLAAPSGADWPEPPSRVVGAVLALNSDPQHLHDGVAHLRVHGVDVQRLDGVGAVAPVLAGAQLSAVWWLPDERVVDPHALLQGYLRGVVRHRGEVRCGVRVESLITEGGRVVGVRVPEGQIRTDRVVLAGGAWSSSLAATAGLRRPLFPLRRTLLQSAPHPLSRPDHPWVWVEDRGVYARPEGGGWLVSACDEAHDPPAAGPGSRGPVDPELRARAQDKVDRTLPALAGLVLDRGWTGLRTFAPDRRPVLGADPDAPGLWWVAGLGGFGVTCGHAAGEAVAAWMRGESTPWLSPRGVSPGRIYPLRWSIRPDGDLHRATLIDGAA